MVGQEVEVILGGGWGCFGGDICVSGQWPVVRCQWVCRRLPALCMAVGFPVHAIYMP